jgi:hypothetical protein
MVGIEKSFLEIPTLEAFNPLQHRDIRKKMEVVREETVINSTFGSWSVIYRDGTWAYVTA